MRKQRVVIGHFGVAKYILAPLRDALQNQSAFFALKKPAELIHPIPADMLLYASQETVQYHVRLFKRLKLANPTLPVLVIESHPDAMQLAQLLRGGADDFLCSGADGYALQDKIRKLLASTQGQINLWEENRVEAISTPAIHYTSPPSLEQNRRRCFRARVGQTLASRVYFIHDECPKPLEIEDLSICTEGEPGGMLLTLPETVNQAFALELNDKPKSLKILVELSKKLGISQASAQIIRTIKHDQKTKVALRYIPQSFSDERRFQRFWIACQQIHRQRELTLNHYMHF